MEPIVTENNVANTPNFNNSITELEKFIEAQRSNLYRVQHDTQSLEELKRQAGAYPGVVLRDIISKQDALKFSNAALGLVTNVPEVDWTLLEADDLKPVAQTRPSEIGSSRVDKMRKHISDFHEALAQLPPLSMELLDNDGDVEERGKKRRRVEPTYRVPATPKSSGLRLPHLTYDSVGLQPSSSAGFPQSPEVGLPSTSSPGTTGHQSPVRPPDMASQLYGGHSDSRRRAWVPKGVSDDTPTRHESPSPISPTTLDTPPTPTQPAETSPVALAMEDSEELPDAGESQSTFKQNWSLAEQHTLERLLVEIPSTVKFRWVRISEAMGGARTPRQVASRVQKYYEKMRKLGVAVNSAEMGGGGRGGSKATQTLDTPPSMRTRGPSTRGKPKTGPKYTKSGRRR
ncbi:unnamed protein product [Rhizoctonia solani]|uniref:Myb-like domain-containing protein n=3 Tax=Rhizoctonia solani TaxID=456999 RepID=A0A8H3D0H0_9AGAM|nr:Myb-like DNA-binding domain protein, putative [Rhizoctonia solani AG-3 Rhs1AP]KEP49262.1 putative Myb-like DNA-binding domain protein [Rhizoctonia solani 123E]CAE6478683.1 unnamed protein product [Rhizoctonia solani]CAE6504439.1 unnamed protein product [Rhizoctonia solani]